MVPPSEVLVRRYMKQGRNIHPDTTDSLPLSTGLLGHMTLKMLNVLRKYDDDTAAVPIL